MSGTTLDGVAKVIEALSKLVWPVVALLAIWFLWRNWRPLLERVSEAEIPMAGLKFKVSLPVYELLYQPLLAELDAAIKSLKKDETELFRDIYSALEQGKGWSVPCDFEREMGTPVDRELHRKLRALRAVNFIQPSVGGPWRCDQVVEIKMFGRLALRLKGAAIGLPKTA